ncbi:MAG: DNA translocase FtsK 4TM domain-containing protein [Chloroflexi bacterium]|nr:DNA translocase FtsK 4TM domain-containing protein [Chloroflexota bacterium]
MPPKRTKSDEKKTFWTRARERFTPRLQRELAGIVFLAVGVFTGASLFRLAFGFVGDLWADLLWKMFGWGAYALPVIAFGASVLLLRRGTNLIVGVAWGRVFAFELFCAAMIALTHLLTPAVNAGVLAEKGLGGGFVGYALSSPIANALGATGGAMVLIAIALLTLPAVIGMSATRLHAWSDALAARANITPRARPVVRPSVAPVEEKIKPEKSRVEPAPRIHPPTPADAPRPVFGKPIQPRLPLKPVAPQLVLSPRSRARRRGNLLPPIDLLDASNESKYGETDANRKARLIEETLDNFGIPAKVVEINAGPTITQFGLEPGFVERRGTDGVVRQRKVSVNRIASLQHDLELALAAAPIRIETPVPGRAIVGIEVPNHSVSLVSLRGIVESEAFKKKKSSLRIALGRDVSGGSTVADLQSMPHLLIAGATGSGKSVCVNTIIACLLMNNSPDDLRFVMVDPKRVELTAYNGIPHLLGPVITNMQEVVPALRWVVREMDARFTLFAKERVRNIEAFNDKMEKENGENRMPYLIALIDELADLMLAAPDETEKLLTRLAQMARATGIHLVIATQRPSVDVVTGLIKANFPSRISFAVTSSVDSRVVLDTTGAEKLLGKGDMLYMASDSSKLSRLQGCFVSDDEIARVVHFWREKAITDMRDVPQDAPWKAMGDGKDGGDEALIEQAIDIAQQFDRTSISFLQRKLGIGYPRAARLMDQLEDRGIVGPDEGGGKPRAVLIHDGDIKEFEAEEPPKKKK